MELVESSEALTSSKYGQPQQTKYGFYEPTGSAPERSRYGMYTPHTNSDQPGYSTSTSFPGSSGSSGQTSEAGASASAAQTSAPGYATASNFKFKDLYTGQMAQLETLPKFKYGAVQPIPRVDSATLSATDVARLRSLPQYSKYQFNDGWRALPGGEEEARSEHSAALGAQQLVTPEMLAEDPYAWLHCFQRAVSLPDGPARRRAVTRVHAAFKRAATEICVRLVKKDPTLSAKNLGGIAGGRKFVVGGIFFKYSEDPMIGPEYYLYGGKRGPSAERAAKAASNELRAANSYFAFFYDFSVPITVPMQMLIYIGGERIIAMPILPIARTDNAKTADGAAAGLVYGSRDGGRSVFNSDALMDMAMTCAARRLHLAPHTIGPVKLAAAGDIEGHVGTDGRLYLLDFSRVFPAECVFNSRACGGDVLQEQSSLNVHLPPAEGSVWFRVLRPEWLIKERDSGFPALSSDAWTAWGADCEQDERLEHNARNYMSCLRFLDVAVKALAEDLDAQAVEDAFPAEAILKEFDVVTTQGFWLSSLNDLFTPLIRQGIPIDGISAYQQVALRVGRAWAGTGVNPSQIACPPARRKVYNRWPGSVDIAQQFHKHGVNIHHLALVRSQSANPTVKIRLWEEMALRAAKQLIRSYVRSHKQTTDDIAAEERLRLHCVQTLQSTARAMQLVEDSAMKNAIRDKSDPDSTINHANFPGAAAAAAAAEAILVGGLNDTSDEVTITHVWQAISERYGSFGFGNESDLKLAPYHTAGLGVETNYRLTKPRVPRWLSSPTVDRLLETTVSGGRDPEEKTVSGVTVKTKTLVFLDLISAQSEVDQALRLNGFDGGLESVPAAASAFFKHIESAYSTVLGLSRSYPSERRVQRLVAVLDDVLTFHRKPQAEGDRLRLALLINKWLSDMVPLTPLELVLGCEDKQSVSWAGDSRTSSWTARQAVMMFRMRVNLNAVALERLNSTASDNEGLAEEILLRTAALLCVQVHGDWNLESIIAGDPESSAEGEARAIDTLKLLTVMRPPSSQHLGEAMEVALSRRFWAITRHLIDFSSARSSKAVYIAVRLQVPDSVLHCLLAHGMDTNHADSQSGQTSLMLACERFQRPLMRHLISHGANVAFCHERTGSCALLVACSSNTNHGEQFPFLIHSLKRQCEGIEFEDEAEVLAGVLGNTWTKRLLSVRFNRLEVLDLDESKPAERERASAKNTYALDASASAIPIGAAFRDDERSLPSYFALRLGVDGTHKRPSTLLFRVADRDLRDAWLRLFREHTAVRVPSILKEGAMTLGGKWSQVLLLSDGTVMAFDAPADHDTNQPTLTLSGDSVIEAKEASQSNTGFSITAKNVNANAKNAGTVKGVCTDTAQCASWLYALRHAVASVAAPGEPQPQPQLQPRASSEFKLDPAIASEALCLSVRNSAENVKLLLECGADPNRSVRGAYPLVLACQTKIDYDKNGPSSRERAVLQRLLDAKANVDTVDQDGYSAFLMMAEIQSHGRYLEDRPELMEMMSRKPNVNLTYLEEKETALLRAARGDHKQAMVEFLMKHGADPNVKDTYNRTVADWKRRQLHVSRVSAAMNVLQETETDSKSTDNPKRVLYRHRLAVLGAGDGGKSTFFKQNIFLFGQGINRHELDTYTPMVHANIISSMVTLCQQSQQDPPTNPEVALMASVMMSQSAGEEVTPSMGEEIATLWADPKIQACWARRSEFQITSNTPYYIKHIKRIAHRNYVATELDALQNRVRTTGIVTNECEWSLPGIPQNHVVEMCDVGGQRNERKKWIHVFPLMTETAQMVDVSEYSEVCYEDGETNRLVESVNLFGELVNSKWTQKLPFFLVFNKWDLFVEKLKTFPFSNFFPEYQGANTPEEVFAWIKAHFFKQNNGHPDVSVYTLSCLDRADVARVVGGMMAHLAVFPDPPAPPSVDSEQPQKETKTLKNKSGKKKKCVIM